jgi:hypothetical protein
MSHAYSVSWLSDEIAEVRSPSGRVYQIRWAGAGWRCPCPDARNRAHQGRCKHVLAFEGVLPQGPRCEAPQ